MPFFKKMSAAEEAAARKAEQQIEAEADAGLAREASGHATISAHVAEQPDSDVNVDEVMRKYDIESNTRIWEGRPKTIISILLAAFSVYCIGMTLFSTFLPETKLAMFVGFVVIIGFILYPASKKHVRVNHMPWYDIVLMVVGAGCFFYFAINAVDIVRLATRIQPIHVVLGVVGILVLMELCRRCVGIPILVVVGCLIIYTFYNQFSFGADFYKALRNVVYKLFYTTSGVIGTPVNVCYTYIVLFIIFGAFLERTGIAAFFISLANRIAGWSSGGAAKVSVIASALCGMVSGSSVGNTVTTGSVTIPMMKKTGYKPEFAGAVEAASSTGGQIMPPIMGAAAFLMAEYMGIPYIEVAAMAIIPALLYFTGIFITVHLEAKKLDLKGIPRDQLPRISYLIKNSYLILPLVLLVWLVSTGARTMAYSAAISILGAFIVGVINFFITEVRSREEGETVGQVAKKVLFVALTMAFESFQGGARSWVSVAVACAMAGMIAGCITVRPCFHAYQLHRQLRRRRHHAWPGSYHAHLHRPGHGRSHHRQLLHHGRNHGAHPYPAGHPGCRRSLLRVLLRHRRRHYAAGCIGRVRRLGNRPFRPHEDGPECRQACNRRVHRPVHPGLQPGYGAAGFVHGNRPWCCHHHLHRGPVRHCSCLERHGVH